MAVGTVLPQQDELRHWQRGEIRQHDLDAGAAGALGAVELVDAELPDGHGLQHGAFAAVVAAHQQIEAREVVDLFADALEVAQGQLSDHAGALVRKR